MLSEANSNKLSCASSSVTAACQSQLRSWGYMVTKVCFLTLSCCCWTLFGEVGRNGEGVNRSSIILFSLDPKSGEDKQVGGKEMYLLCSFVPELFTRYHLGDGRIEEDEDEYVCFIGLLFFYLGPFFLPISSLQRSLVVAASSLTLISLFTHFKSGWWQVSEFKNIKMVSRYKP